MAHLEAAKNEAAATSRIPDDWNLRAAENGHASAKNNLGTLFTTGRGIPANRVVAYALFNLCAINDPSREDKAEANRNALAASMPAKDIEAAEVLTLELSKPENLLKALEAHNAKPASD